MSTEVNDIDGQDLRAAEYVLGLLDAEARKDAEARLRDDEQFAAEVARWEARFAPWLEAVVPVEAPLDLWPRIRSTLWSHELQPPADVPVKAPLWWQSLALWRGLAIGGMAATAASLVFMVVNPHQPQPSLPPRVIAAQPPKPIETPVAIVLRQDNGRVAYTATLDSHGTMVITPVQADRDSRAPELWLIAPGAAPRSLGMLQGDRPIALRLPSTLRAAARASLFAVSLEPAGSGPHEAPTGPVVAKGSVIAL